MYGNQQSIATARSCAVCRQLATVVTVTGDISDANVDHISACAKRFVLTEKPFVLDLGGVDSFSTECISLLYAVDEVRDRAGVEWLVIASQPVHRTLRLFGERETFPTVASVAEALHHFAVAMANAAVCTLLTKTA